MEPRSASSQMHKTGKQEMSAQDGDAILGFCGKVFHSVELVLAVQPSVS